jgi:hypothetical protein
MMIINGIDFDRRIDRLKEITHKHIDCLFEIQNIMDAEPNFVAPLEYVARAIRVATAINEFERKIIFSSAPIGMPIGGISHGEELIIKP